MPYIKFLDESKNETPIPPIDAALVELRMTAPRVDGALYTLVNVNTVYAKPTPTKCTAMFLGLCNDVDTPPFTIIPLEQVRYMNAGDRLAFAPGYLILDMITCKAPADSESVD